MMHSAAGEEKATHHILHFQGSIQGSRLCVFLHMGLL